ncbi:glycosyltransferase family 2 protein [Thermomicrobium sp. 4228-Ro]|uniref:glycosyltransferase family 2 protein n=1 Tax=Thermomicrobium sp. 4228-Ro TaxID=2993937 RepID=UPI002248F7EC|nr:glycosyltransferase family 2 protein [Thermomicrobium sp. 4228-Ro]MCX2727879.1 glycosyltransferase family 2 protein [Thermomicrobium sp. 4228-Ro]
MLQPPQVTAAAPQGVWVVIVNYNTAHLLERCLTALRASTLDRPCTVFVVDNGSHDGSVALVRERFPEAVLLETGANVGFARANNVALRRVLALVPDRARRAHAVLLLNSDCFVEPETIQRLVTVLEREPDVAIVGPKLVLPDGRLDLACRRSFPTPGTALWKLTGLARLFPRSRWFARYNLTYRDPDEPLEVDAVSGACMLVRLQAVVEAGLLDEAFFMYGEDLDWAYRIKQRGWRVRYEPSARAVHVKGGSWGRRDPRILWEFYRAMALFYRRHYAAHQPVLLRWLVYAGIGMRFSVALVGLAVRRFVR